ncbi:hypothetical protein [Actinomadura keratinilytica]|jgi:hypothetical protein|uniref:Uncharacterized protein n=1 Tax=Actinomadura keratinilytica TaxID=547461 RepID=A0ABP7Z2C4_9ACTN
MTAPHGEAPGAHRVRLVVGRADPPSGGSSGVPGVRDVEPADLRDPDAEIFGWTCTCGNGSAFLHPLWRARQMAADHQETMERLALRGELVAGAVPSVLPESAAEIAALITRLAQRLGALALSVEFEDDREIVLKHLGTAAAAIEMAQRDARDTRDIHDARDADRAAES